MKAYVVSKPGGPEVLELKTLPDPVAKEGQAVIQIHAFGLNRAEAITRAGGSYNAVKFPKVIGIECVGEVLNCPGGELKIGQKVAAAMGGMGRQYNGSYAEKTVVPVSNIFPINTELGWVSLASLPETYFTAWGCLFESLKVQTQPRIVIRPGASALGIAATQIVNHIGGEVIGVTRTPSKAERLYEMGMSSVIISSTAIADQVLKIWPEGATGIIDTISSELTVKDDYEMLTPGGKICLAGSLAESYDHNTKADQAELFIRDEVGYYSSETLHTSKDTATLQTIIERVESKIYKVHIDTIFGFDNLVKAHELMERNAFAGKVVISLA